MQRTGDLADLLEQGCVLLHRMAADLQQRQHEGVELVAHRNACEAEALALACRDDGEGRLAGCVACAIERDRGRQRCDLVQQLEHLLRGWRVVEGGRQFNRARQPLEVGSELCLQRGVKHEAFLSTGLGGGGLRLERSGARVVTVRSFQPDRATVRVSFRLPSTSRGRLRPDVRGRIWRPSPCAGVPWHLGRRLRP